MIKDLLVGSTGFVGGNLKAVHNFEKMCHSADVGNYFGSNPDLCIYAGIPSAMFLANSVPEKDLQIMHQARENLRQINPKKVVLISTIAVYGDSVGKNERDLPEPDSAYGKNRFLLEQWVKTDFPDASIIRLPALYGMGLKKNFLYDMHTIIPSMLKPEIYTQIANQNKLIQSSYTLSENGFFVLNKDCDKKAIRHFFEQSNFNALCFTDSRSQFQFYGLSELWRHIQIVLNEKLELVNMCTPPVSAGHLYYYLTGKKWENKINNKKPFGYDLRSLYAEQFNGKENYLCSLEQEIQKIRLFMQNWSEIL